MILFGGMGAWRRSALLNHHRYYYKHAVRNISGIMFTARAPFFYIYDTSIYDLYQCVTRGRIYTPHIVLPIKKNVFYTTFSVLFNTYTKKKMIHRCAKNVPQIFARNVLYKHMH